MKSYHLYLDIVLLLIIMVIGIWILWEGIKGIWMRHPVYIVDRGPSFRDYLLRFLVWTVFIASIGIQILETNDNGLSLEGILVVLLVSISLSLLAGILPQIRRAKSSSTAGVMILGINNKVLTLIGQTLTKEGIAFQEMHEDFELPDLNARIYTSLWSSVGYAMLKIDPKEKFPVLEKIIHAMKAYDKDHADHFSLKFMIILVLCGMVLAGVCIFLAYSLIKNIIV